MHVAIRHRDSIIGTKLNTKRFVFCLAAVAGGIYRPGDIAVYIVTMNFYAACGWLKLSGMMKTAYQLTRSASITSCVVPDDFHDSALLHLLPSRRQSFISSIRCTILCPEHLQSQRYCHLFFWNRHSKGRQKRAQPRKTINIWDLCPNTIALFFYLSTVLCSFGKLLTNVNSK